MLAQPDTNTLSTIVNPIHYQSLKPQVQSKMDFCCKSKPQLLMWCIFGAGVLNFSVFVFFLSKSLEDVHILEGEGAAWKENGGNWISNRWRRSHTGLTDFLCAAGIFSPQRRLSSVCSRGFPAFTWCISPGLSVYFHVQQQVISQVFLPNFPCLQLRISLSFVVTLFAASILEALKRLCCLVSPFKSPNPAGLYQV